VWWRANSFVLDDILHARTHRIAMPLFCFSAQPQACAQS
jgi:hypothetical protein